MTLLSALTGASWLLVCRCDQIPDKKRLKEGGFILLTVGRYDLSLQGMNEAVGHIASTVRKQSTDRK